MDPAVTLSIILPVLNEAALIAPLLSDLRQRFGGAELIVVDGGSVDQTANRARALADRFISAAPGRAVQMNAGAAVARGRIVLFLHADTRLPDNAQTAIIRGIDGSGHVWGRFDVRIQGQHPLLPVIAALMNLRSRLTGVATGDQAMFVARAAFDAVGGYPAIALMEDIALSKLLRRIGAPLCLRSKVTTSGRRWEANGVVRTILVMWALRLGYVVGVSPDRLGRLWGRLRRR